MISRMTEADKEAFMKLSNWREGQEDFGPLHGRVITNSYKARLSEDAKIITGEKVPFGYKITGRDASRVNHR